MTAHDGFDSAALRRDFDRGFALPRASAAEPVSELVAVRAAGEALALKLQDVAGLLAGLPLRSLPSRSPALLGLLVHRGVLVPVFGLARLLGNPAAPAGRWFVLLAGPELVALAADAYEGLFRVPLASLEPSAREGSLLLGVAHHAGATRSVLDAAALVSSIRKQSPSSTRQG